MIGLPQRMIGSTVPPVPARRRCQLRWHAGEGTRGALECAPVTQSADVAERDVPPPFEDWRNVFAISDAGSRSLAEHHPCRAYRTDPGQSPCSAILIGWASAKSVSESRPEGTAGAGSP